MLLHCSAHLIIIRFKSSSSPDRSSDRHLPVWRLLPDDFLDRKIFLHIRRGDPKLPWAYVNLETTHPVCTFDYYEKALAEFPEDIPVVVFSDHIEWCKEQEFFAPDRFIMSESTEEFSDGQRVPWTDLCLMSLCTDAIIANSSFSWWGAWLANRGEVIAPKKWFGPNLNHDTKDLYCPEWKVL